MIYYTSWKIRRNGPQEKKTHLGHLFNHFKWIFLKSTNAHSLAFRRTISNRLTNYSIKIKQVILNNSNPKKAPKYDLADKILKK